VDLRVEMFSKPGSRSATGAQPLQSVRGRGQGGVQSGGRGEGGVFWAKGHQPLTTEADSKCRGQGTVVYCAAVSI
jgi:hypothetical protein